MIEIFPMSYKFSPKTIATHSGRGDFCGYGYPSVFSNIQMVASIVQPIFSGPAATELLVLVNRVHMFKLLEI